VRTLTVVTSCLSRLMRFFADSNVLTYCLATRSFKCYSIRTILPFCLYDYYNRLTVSVSHPHASVPIICTLLLVFSPLWCIVCSNSSLALLCFAGLHQFRTFREEFCHLSVTGRSHDMCVCPYTNPASLLLHKMILTEGLLCHIFCLMKCCH